jgi:TRAP-type C4-dicarboxylate transport system substrate-binding protein
MGGRGPEVTEVDAKRLVLAGMAAALCTTAWADETTIKFATLAPEGSVWMKALRRGGTELKDRSGGSVLLKYYPGGVSGDEVDVVRKMRLGQLHAAGMTGVGLSEILPEFHVLELPLLFRDGTEVDFVLEKTFEMFAERFAEKGFRLLGLTETGFVHFFSRVPIQALEDFKRPELKPWIWDQDHLHDVLFADLGMHPMPLGVPDVLASLQTGMINNVNAPPAAAVALQWHTKVTSMTADTFWWTSGGIVMTEKAWNELDAAQQATTAEVLGSTARELRALARTDNEKAFEALKARGIEVPPPLSAEDRKRLEEIAARVRTSLVGKIYSAQTLDAVESALAEVRTAPSRP